MTSTIIKRSGEATFEKVRKGQIFYCSLGVYIKTADGDAVSLHKEAGHMNAGETVNFKNDTVVQIITSVVFNVGIHS